MNIKYFLIAIILSIIIPFLIGLLLKVISIKEFNKGICKKCNGEINLSFIDSQGNYCYYCKNCGKSIGFGFNLEKYRI